VADRFQAIFGADRKPVIAMAHLGPLPGTPLYDEARGVPGIVGDVARDLDVLLRFPFDAVMFCNEGDRPYSLRAGFEGVAVMTRVVAGLAPSDRPYGVDFLWDGRAALAVAAATGASFIREVVTGAYESDMGVWAPDAGELLRYRRTLGAQHVAVFMNVTPEFASTLGSRTVAQLARSAAVSSLADAILVSGPMAGAAPDPARIREAKQAAGDLAPVLANTGAKAGNVAEFLGVADGVIVGSDLKAGGGTWNPVDPERVKRFLEAAGRL
jgi:membrane complex biogenesis BtpA family protein